MLMNRFSGVINANVCCKNGLSHLHGDLQVQACNSISGVPLDKYNRLYLILSIFASRNVIKHSDCKVDYT